MEAKRSHSGGLAPGSHRASWHSEIQREGGGLSDEPPAPYLPHGDRGGLCVLPVLPNDHPRDILLSTDIPNVSTMVRTILFTALLLSFVSTRIVHRSGCSMLRGHGHHDGRTRRPITETSSERAADWHGNAHAHVDCAKTKELIWSTLRFPICRLWPCSSTICQRQMLRYQSKGRPAVAPMLLATGWWHSPALGRSMRLATNRSSSWR